MSQISPAQTSMVTCLVDDPVGCLIENLMRIRRCLPRRAEVAGAGDAVFAGFEAEQDFAEAEEIPA